jgi:carbonic anhydrase
VGGQFRPPSYPSDIITKEIFKMDREQSGASVRTGSRGVRYTGLVRKCRNFIKRTNEMKSDQIFLAGIMGCILCCTLTLSAQAPKSSEAHASFSYTGDTGPGFWDEINSECATTSTSRQSPIDIDKAAVDRSLTPLDTDLQGTSFTLTNPGYTLKATPATSGTLTLNGIRYTLLQFHFHTLSEHSMKGKHSVMELHAVFQDENSNLAVIGVLYRVGKANPFLAKILSAGLPEKTTSDPVTVSDLNLANAFTDLSSYYTYPGSLTTPPCSETVTWLVLKQQDQLSASQYEEFRKVLGNDFRPLQATNGRLVRATPGKGD